MKKFIYLFVLAIGFTSCSVESIDSMENLATADAKFKIQDVEKSMILKETEICYGESSLFVFDFPQNQNGPNDTDTKIKIQIETSPGSGEWLTFKDLSYDGAGPEEYIYEDEVLDVGTYSFRAKIGSGGFDHFATLTVSNCNTCEDSLIADITCGDLNILNLTFTAEKAGPIVIQGGLTNGTNIESKESNVLTENENHPGVVNSDANVTRWEGDVEACQEITITITFTGGNGIGDWSAKRGEETLGETDAFECN